MRGRGKRLVEVVLASGRQNGEPESAVRPGSAGRVGPLAFSALTGSVQTLLDIAVALVVTALTIASLAFNENDDSAVVPTVIVSVIVGIALIARRRMPFAVLGLVLAMAIPTVLTDAGIVSVAAGGAVALYTIASRWPRRTTMLATAISIVIILGLIVATRGDLQGFNESLSVLVWVALAAAVGDAVRSRRAFVQVLQDRAQRAEETREQTALARVTEERLRIAQELHDIVAHHIAVVNIQAGLASRAMAKEAYGTAVIAVDRVSEAARSALDDLSAVLRLLRATDDGERREPVPGLAQVSELVGSYAHADDRIHWTIRGKTVPLDAASELTAYRVIQEALTNATKHGVPGETRLVISWETDGLAIAVSNPVRTAPGGNPPAPVGTGYGVIGLHERVGSVGGRITADRQPDGHFVVRAMIPYSPPRQTDMEQTP